MIINHQTNLRFRSSHKTLLSVLTTTSGYKSNGGVAEVSFRLLAEAMITHRLAQSRPDPDLEVLLAALNAAAYEAHPIRPNPWYRIAVDCPQLQRWSIDQQAYQDLGFVVGIPQMSLRRRA